MSEQDQVGFHGAWITPQYPNPLSVFDIPHNTSGLSNTTGNTCYINASLQALLHCPPLTSFFCNFIDHPICPKFPFCSRCELGVLAEKMFRRTTTNRSLGPDHIVRNVKQICPAFNDHEQEDAHEFLSALIGHIAGNEIAHPKDIATTTLMHAPIYKILGGALGSETICVLCETTKETTEFMPSLSVPTNEATTIEDALKKYVEFANVDGKLHCHTCQTKTNAIKRYFIRRAPNVLLLNLLPRYRVSRNGTMLKDDSATSYARISEHLDLAPYMLHPDNKYVTVPYTLTGVVVHKGRSMRSGHYMAYVKGKNGIWLHKDDNNSTQVPLSTVLNQNAYILFYARDTVHHNTLENLLNPTGFSVPGSRQQQNIAKQPPKNPSVLSYAAALKFSPASPLSRPTAINSAPRDEVEVRRNISSSASLGINRSHPSKKGSPSIPGDHTPFHRSLVNPSQIYRRVGDAEHKVHTELVEKPAPTPKSAKRRSKKKKILYCTEGPTDFHKSFYNPSRAYRPMPKFDE